MWQARTGLDRYADLLAAYLERDLDVVGRHDGVVQDHTGDAHELHRGHQITHLDGGLLYVRQEVVEGLEDLAEDVDVTAARHQAQGHWDIAQTGGLLLGFRAGEEQVQGGRGKNTVLGGLHQLWTDRLVGYQAVQVREVTELVGNRRGKVFGDTRKGFERDVALGENHLGGKYLHVARL